MSGGRQRTLPQVWRAAGGKTLEEEEEEKKEEEEKEEAADDDLLLAAAAAAADPSPAAGFCAAAGSLWIYPTNYPVRGYQLRMAGASLLANTLVCLPTGLGKTFVAAVVMYNFYRWFPSGKVLFLAPTKPLVAQQMEACARVMGIPARHMAEMTGREGGPRASRLLRARASNAESLSEGGKKNNSLFFRYETDVRKADSTICQIVK